MLKRKKILAISGLVILVLLIFINIPEKKRHIKTEHFTFNFSKSIDTVKIAGLAQALNNSYQRISSDLKTIPFPNIEVNIYAQRWRYIKATGHWSASGNIEGISRLHFVEQAWGEVDNSKVAVHEFTHAVVLKLLIDNDPTPSDSKTFDKKFSTFPIWLWEAISVYEARQFIDPKTLPYLNNGSYPDLQELNNRSKGGKIYQVGFTMIEYILDRYGKDRFLELVRNYGNLDKAFGIKDETFCKDWYAFVTRKYINK